MTQYSKKLAHLFDATQCVGCSACIVACAQTNYPDMLNDENSGWKSLPSNIRVVRLETLRRPQQILVQCQQCDDAPCIGVCPFGANYHDPLTGQVKTDPDRCVGCGYCPTTCAGFIRRRDFPSSAWAKGAKSSSLRGRIRPASRPARSRRAPSATSRIRNPPFRSALPARALNAFSRRKALSPTTSSWCRNDS